jgi:hypothetical protein
MELPPLDNAEPEPGRELVGRRTSQNGAGREGLPTLSALMFGQCLIPIGDRPHRGALVDPGCPQPHRDMAIPQRSNVRPAKTSFNVNERLEGCRARRQQRPDRPGPPGHRVIDQ